MPRDVDVAAAESVAFPSRVVRRLSSLGMDAEGANPCELISVSAPEGFVVTRAASVARSSGTTEDTSGESFAGVNETYADAISVTTDALTRELAWLTTREEKGR